MRSTATALTSALLVAAGMIGAGQALAHHSFATHYIMNQPIELTGTVTSVTLRNPHSFIVMDVTNEQGVTEEWDIEIHAVPLMRRLGFDNDTLQPGDTLRLIGPTPRTEKRVTLGVTLFLPDGRQLELGGIGTNLTKKLTEQYAAAEIDATAALIDRLAGLWSRSSPRSQTNETTMPLTEAGWTARANYDPRNTPAMNCIPPNLPSMFYAPYLLEFRTTGAQPEIFHEYHGVPRPLDLTGGGAVALPATFGERTARIEGETLVVESGGFLEDAAGLASDWDDNGQNRNTPSSPQKSVVERYTLQENDQLLVLDYTVEDPVYLTEPFADQIQWRRLSEEAEIFDMGCDLGIATRSTLNAAAPEDL